MQDPQGFCAKEEGIAPGSGVSNPSAGHRLRYKMLHYCYIVIMLRSMGRKPKEETPVFNRLEEVREARGLSRTELAYGADVHYQTIGYIERGEYSPSLSLALTLAKILRTDVQEIFSLQPFTKKKVSAS